MSETTLGASVVATLRQRGQTLSTAESCTGGQLAAAITAVPGSSAAYIGGIVAYANSVKQALLEVPEALLLRAGAVSLECARAMAQGCQHGFATDWALSTTGIAGPDGGSADKPVGLVCFGWARAGGWVHSEQQLFTGHRAAVQALSVNYSLRFLLRLIEEQDAA